MKRPWASSICLMAVALLAGVTAHAAERAAYRSPLQLAFSPDGKLLAVSDRTAGELVLIDVSRRKVARHLALRGEPMGVAWSAPGHVLVAEYGRGSVAEVDARAGRVIRRIAVGPKPVGVAVAPRRKLLLVAEFGLNAVKLIDLTSGAQRKQIEAVHAAYFVTVAPDESTAAVGNLLPVGPAGDFGSAAAVSLIDLERLEKTADVKLPGGSTTVRELAISPNGRWLYATHTRGQTALPTIQLHYGWVNSNAVSIIDLGSGKLYATMLLDRLRHGAGDPWGVAVSPDGKKLHVTLAGVAELAEVDLAGLHPLLAGEADEEVLRRARTAETPSTLHIWDGIKRSPKTREWLAADFTAMTAADLLTRTELPCRGPRGLDVSPDGRLLAAAAYYSGQVLLIDARSGRVASRVAMGPRAEPDLVRRGEILFHDATLAQENWLSCATCHPHGRADGLNWDLPNDGTANPKNARSLLLAHRTPPSMTRGVRADYEVAVAAGLRGTLFHEPAQQEIEALKAYIRSLEPEPSPYLAAGRLSKSARKGKAIFESPATGCARCHPAPLFTDLRMRDVGTCFESLGTGILRGLS